MKLLKDPEMNKYKNLIDNPWNIEKEAKEKREEESGTFFKNQTRVTYGAS